MGLSGGPDSVCLLTVLNTLRDELKLRLYAVYVDHGLRPGETPHEIEFCRKFCEGSSVILITRSVDVKTYAEGHDMNKQEAARDLRYEIFHEVLADIGADKIALGHTADDQIETFFMRFLRGSGPKGLSGIPPVRTKIIRPLIEIDRGDIERYLDAQGINPILDSSNLKGDYIRNRIRLFFIPEIKKMNPHIVQTVSRTMDILREEENYFDILITKTLMKLISRKSDLRIELFLVPMVGMDTVILRRVLRRAIDETRGLRGMSFNHIEDSIDLIKRGKAGDRLNLPKGLRIIKNYSTLVITSEMPQRLNTLAFTVPGEVVLGEIKAIMRMSLEKEVDGLGDGRTTAVFDADKTGTTLTIRSRKEGDFFYPRGFGRKKKLQDYFVDEKVPRDERDAIPIVAAGHDIIWIAGFRGDERFMASDETKRFLKCEYKKAI
ncbi:MAG: tRNA lysidine(34) synthetase TilS [Thermodesulfovibrionales bacterium]